MISLKEKEDKVVSVKKYLEQLTDQGKTAQVEDSLNTASSIYCECKRAYNERVKQDPIEEKELEGGASANIERSSKDLQPSVILSISLKHLHVEVYSVLHRLHLDLTGNFTFKQIQTLKICLLVLINRGYFSNLDYRYLEDYAQKLSEHLPDDEYTPNALYGLLLSNKLNPEEVLFKEGFRFCS